MLQMQKNMYACMHVYEYEYVCNYVYIYLYLCVCLHVLTLENTSHNII